MANFFYPTDVTVGCHGDVYVADPHNKSSIQSNRKQRQEEKLGRGFALVLTTVILCSYVSGSDNHNINAQDKFIMSFGSEGGSVLCSSWSIH